MSCKDGTCEMEMPENAENEKLRYMVQGLTGEQLTKLRRWLDMEPIDYDAPGSRTREQEGMT